VARFDRVIPPGGEGKVLLEINTDRLEGKSTKGVRVTSNDPGWPEVNLQLSFTVKRMLQISPKSRIFIPIKKGEPWTREFKVTSSEGKPFKIISVTSSHKYLSADFKPVGGEPDEAMTYIVEVEASRDIPVGRFTATVEVKTDLYKDLKETIWIFGKVKGSISYRPEQISLRPNHRINEGQVSRTIHLIESDGQGFKIEGVETNHKDIIFKIVPVEEGRSYVLVLIWTGKECKKEINGGVIISTNNNDMPQITIPYRILPHL
jgi:hypothetical protein